MEAVKTVARPCRPNAEPHAPRRRLADNVVCMFAEERPPVTNIRRRGKNPRNVIPLWKAAYRRLRPGAVAEIVKSRNQCNVGQQVMMIARAKNENGGDFCDGSRWWQVEALHEPLQTYVIETGQASGKEWTTLVREEHLRRLHFAYIKPASRT